VKPATADRFICKTQLVGEPTAISAGSRFKSDALPGRCTETSGYIAYAELTELLFAGDGVETFHDGQSNTDVMLCKGESAILCKEPVHLLSSRGPNIRPPKY
jgi:hypothetical protein